MEIVKTASKWGNSAGVVLPRNWVGKQVKITLIDRTEKIKEETFDILKDDLEEIIGIYLVGSYARGEENENSDIDIIAISNHLKKEISSGKFNISIYPLKSIKKTLKKNPIIIYPRLLEAKAIMNKKVLEDLKNEKIGKNKKYLSETKRIIKINEKMINLFSKNKVPDSVIYSLILRLRGILSIKKMNKKEILMKRDFLKTVSKLLGSEAKEAIESYVRIKSGKPEKEIVKIGVARKIIDYLKKEVENAEQKENKKRN